MRFLSVFLPFLPTDRIRRSEGSQRVRPDAPQAAPLATWAKIGSAQKLVAVDRAARQAGLLPGMALASARAMRPDLDLRQALLDEIEARLREQGFHARCAIAPNPALAWALARFSTTRILESEDHRGAAKILRTLPIAALRVSADIVAGLRTAGLSRVGDLLTRPRSPLAARFGVAVSEKIAAQAAPVIGAVGGAAVNAAFASHFQALARGHFIVRRLERRHGAAAVQFEYRRLAAARRR